MNVLVWHFSLILRSDCFNQSWLKMLQLNFFRKVLLQIKLCQFFSLQPIPLESLFSGDWLEKKKKKKCLQPGSSRPKQSFQDWLGLACKLFKDCSLLQRKTPQETGSLSKYFRVPAQGLWLVLCLKPLSFFTLISNLNGLNWKKSIQNINSHYEELLKSF